MLLPPVQDVDWMTPVFAFYSGRGNKKCYLFSSLFYLPSSPHCALFILFLYLYISNVFSSQTSFLSKKQRWVADLKQKTRWWFQDLLIYLFEEFKRSRWGFTQLSRLWIMEHATCFFHWSSWEFLTSFPSNARRIAAKTFPSDKTKLRQCGRYKDQTERKTRETRRLAGASV